ncbi:hypothetical protein D3C72_1395160 [compost metagenome]
MKLTAPSVFVVMETLLVSLPEASEARPSMAYLIPWTKGTGRVLLDWEFRATGTEPIRPKSMITSVCTWLKAPALE